MKKLLAKLGNPENCCPAIHVAGTNGKGSTAAMIHAMLVKAGYKVGLYTSPHFLDKCERIKVNNKFISRHDLEKNLARVQALKGADKLHYFDIITAVAFLYFAAKKVDMMILEVGLGGRCDATNAVKNKLVSIITSIDYDHTELLGNTLVKIAREKAGIIKPNVPVVAYTGHKITDAVIKKNAPTYFLGKDFNFVAEKTVWKKSEQYFSYKGIYKNYSNLVIHLLGKHQLQNASLALAAVEIISKTFPLKDSAVYQGIADASWPGRFEVRQKKINGVLRTVILDGAHNVAGVKALCETLLASPYKPANMVLVLSVLSDKNYREICKNLKKIFKKLIAFKVDSSRALDPEVLVKIWGKNAIAIERLSDLSKVLSKKDKCLCITGSLYGIADALRL